MGGGGEGTGLTALPNLGNSLVSVKETVAPDFSPTSGGLTAILISWNSVVLVKGTVARYFFNLIMVLQHSSALGILLFS